MLQRNEFRRRMPPSGDLSATTRSTEGCANVRMSKKTSCAENVARSYRSGECATGRAHTSGGPSGITGGMIGCRVDHRRRKLHPSSPALRVRVAFKGRDGPLSQPPPANKRIRRKYQRPNQRLPQAPAAVGPRHEQAYQASAGD
jgi:hypothetical protein